MTDLDARLVAAIQRSSLGDEARRMLASGTATDEERRQASAAVGACRRIAAELADESRRLTGLLSDAGIAAEHEAGPQLPQRHEIRFRTSRDDARRATAALVADGYRRHPEWTGGAERSFWSTSTEVGLTRTTSWTTVVRLRWEPARTPSALGRAFRPRPPDWDAVRLPAPLWWAYRLVRPTRLALHRVGIMQRDHAALEPFLATPTSLIDPLIALAGVTPDDLVADIGCGDGRILIRAAATGCRAVGVEYSAHLAAAAQRAVDAAGLGDRVRIVEGDGRTLDVADVTVVLLFLPMAVAVDLVPHLLARLPAGARLVLHEQGPLAAPLPPATSSTPIITDDAVTVAHLWRVGNRALDDAAPSPAT